jgi:dipeptidase
MLINGDKKAVLELYEKNPDEAIAFITDFSVNNAKAVIDAWWKLGDDLLVKYNHFRIYDAETRKVDRVQTPESWNRAIIEHDKLVSMTPPPPPPKKKKEN